MKKPSYHLFATATLVLFASCLNQQAYAENVDSISHVIINDSSLGTYFELSAVNNSFCNTKGYLSPGQIKVLPCQSSDVSSYGSYVLETQPEGWQGYSMRDSMLYTVSHNAQITWRLAITNKPRGNVLGITVDEQPM